MTMPADPSTRLFTLRAGRALVLGVLAIAAVGWVVSRPGVLLALACGVPAALVMPRFRRLSVPIASILAVTGVGAVAGSLLWGQGSAATRVGAGLIVSLAVGPWSVVLGYVLWVRAHRA